MNLIEIIFEDQDIIVINKPASVVVNRATTAKETTIQEWAEKKLNIENYKSNSKIEEEFSSRGGVVHRLDKETSGVLLIAKNAFSFENLKNQFKDRSLSKTYIALAHGLIRSKEGQINVPIGRLPWNRTRFGVLAEGREAKTFYKVVDYRNFLADKKKQELTLVELYPKTGRTHQIRVHLFHLGYPIFSDILYAGRKNAKNDRKYLSRHFLHASKLSFKHPRSNQVMDLEAQMPADLIAFLNSTKLQ